MSNRIAAAFAALTIGTLFGSGAQALADDIRYGVYDNRGACEAAGADTPAHPGWTRYECRPAPSSSWELYLVN
ncbi:hypothetical protein [Nocardia mexicana]|uniref:Uncharacterized protein n=1 Tax=Nocardia mexicana TaxID=279262 RepID=A0A370GSJ8_9NOCA|nr:hypothetical protein [Nocardia mexicana]RDI46471.1 hypothetical protein DFR68_111230 [Nocardia mexicana]